MASAGDKYLPDLAKCFAGEATVFSWRETFDLLNDTVENIDSQLVNLLISSTKIRALLSQNVPSFDPPSQQSKNQFETRTAAIHVPQASKSQYDINEIKSDTVWLSEEVKVAEDEALRMVLFNWQQEPVEKLVSGFSDAELASLQEVLGSQNSIQSMGFFVKTDEEKGEATNERRLRILGVYFKECEALLCISRWLEELGLLMDDDSSIPENLQQYARELAHTTSRDTAISDIVVAVESRLRALAGERAWSINHEESNDSWIASGLKSILSLQESIFLRIRRSTNTVPTQTILSWAQMLAQYDFFATLESGPLLSQSQIESLQAITSLTLLAMLDPTTAMYTLGNSSGPGDHTTFFLDTDAAHELNSILVGATEAGLSQASLSGLAWSLILSEIQRMAVISRESRENGAVQRALDQVATSDTGEGRRASAGSLQQSIYEDIVDGINNTTEIRNMPEYLRRLSIEEAGAFEALSILTKAWAYRSSLLHASAVQLLQELLSVAASLIGYEPELLSCQFAILSTRAAFLSKLPDAKETFVKSDFLVDSILTVAARRFPHEAVPFLRLCRYLASAEVYDDHGTQYITFRLRSLDSFTQSATGAYAAYHTVREDENLNLVALDGAVNMLRGFQKNLINYGQDEDAKYIIPADTLGEVVSESIPPVVRWQHSYSGLTLFGVWLELHYLGQLQNILSPYDSTDDVVAEIIGTITALLRNTPRRPSSSFDDQDRRQLQDEILDDANHALQSDYTVADYIFEILEQELQAYRRRPSNSFNTSILTSCIDFASAYSETKPDQFWSLFSKSSLLESYGSDSFFLSIVSGVEAPNQTFPFLESCANLFDSVIKVVLSQPPADTSRSRATKFKNSVSHTLRLHAKVLLSITQSMCSCFESIPGWNFASIGQQCEIVTLLAKSFENILHHTYAIHQSKSGLTATYGPSAEFLFQQLGFSIDDLSTKVSIVRHIFHLQDLPGCSESWNGDENNKKLGSLLKLATTLIRISSLRGQLPSALSQQILSIVPLLGRYLTLPISGHIVDLLQSLLSATAEGDSVSLLGYLGSNSSLQLLEVLKLKLLNGSSGYSRSRLWDLLSSLIGRNQQWLAIVILTGSPPQKNLRADTCGITKELRGRTFLEAALKQLVKIAELDPVVAISMINFVIQSQMNWSWANEAMRSNRDFLPSILSYVCNTYVDPADELKVSYRNKLAALVTDLSTIQLHHAKANRETTTLKTIAPLLKWLSDNAINVSSYKHSLHVNLRKNFASRFKGFQLDDFKRTGLIDAQYGRDFYYDLNFAHMIFLAESQWNGNGKHRDQSFSAECRRANLNLSVVDSEVRLLGSFLNLSVEHSGFFTHDAEIQATVIDIVKKTLDANAQTYPTEKIFEDVKQTRADIAMSLLQRLADAKVKAPGTRELLNHAWECARLNNGSFEQAVIGNDLKYWRSMLTIVLLTLQFQVEKRYMPPAADPSAAALLRHTEQAIPAILEIVTVVIGQGFKSVVAAIQDQRRSGPASESSPTSVSHRDVYFILTIFDTILRMTRLPEFVVDAAQRLVAEGTIQSCLLLYSWSHTLSAPGFDHERIHAGYCLQFLASLSALPPITEELAVEGVLSRILSSRMTQNLQAIPDGAGHIDKRPQAQGMYELWATGILPICLNLLYGVGAPVAAEVSSFLNQFPNQLGRASTAFVSSPSRGGQMESITSTVASEATTLALISFILSSFRGAGASAAVDPSLVQPLVGYDEHKKALFEDISDIVKSSSSNLKNRIIASTEQETAMAREANGEKLIAKVVVELRNALVCLKGEEVEDES